MLPLPTLLAHEIFLSKSAIVRVGGGGASSGEALRDFGDRGRGVGSKGGCDGGVGRTA